MTKEEITKKYEALLKEKGSLLATEDGQVFYNNAEGKKFATAHAAAKKVQIMELKYKAPAAKKKAASKAKKSTEEK
jgi:hypothetical protein